MIVCPNCDAPVADIGAKCARCGVAPERQHDFTLFAPQLAFENDGFDTHAHAHLDEMQQGHFWFEHRNALICALIRRHAPRASSILEVGCGTGYVLEAISACVPNAKLYGAEIHLSGLLPARRRLGDQTALFQMDATQIPFEDEFDVVGAFDVIEHIDDDERVLQQFFKAAAPGGCVLISAPQHMWLWSAADEYGHHKRRYAPSELSCKAHAAGFVVERDTSFVTSLLPAMWAQRSRSKDIDRYDATGELGIAPWLNALFGAALWAERTMIGIGVDLPIGGSRFVALRKPTTTENAGHR